MISLLTIARITWKEILSRKVLIITILLSLIFLAVYWYIGWRALQTSYKNETGYQFDALAQYALGSTMVGLGLYLANFMVAYLAIFSTVGTISSELDSGVLLSVLSRPIARWRVYAGKWIGYAVWGMLFSAVMYWAILLIAHVAVGFQLYLGADIHGCLVMFLIPLVLVTLAMLASIYLPPLTGGIALTILFGIGLIGGLLQEIPNINASLTSTGFTIGLFIPTDPAYHRMMYEALNGQMLADFSTAFAVGSSAPSGWFMVYILAYVAAFLLFGMYRFTRRDIT